MTASKKPKRIPTCPLGHVVLALEDYFDRRCGHGVAGEVAAVFEPYIDDAEVVKYCEEEYGLSVLNMAQILHKKNTAKMAS